MLVLFFLLIRGQMDLLCAVLAIGVLLLMSALDRGLAIMGSFAFLMLLGELRRIVTVSFGRPKLDLLLLVAPLMAFYLALPSLLSLRLRDLLSKAFFVLLVVMVLEIFNPQQGGLVVGFSGALFYIAPVLWFWVGRQYASPALVERFLYYLLLPLSTAAAVLGLSQTFLGFLPYDQSWIKHYGYSSLSVGGVTRAFGFSVSASEYAGLVAIGAAIVIAAALAKRQGWLLLLPLLVTVLFLASSRGLILKLLFSASISWLLRNSRNIGPATFLKLGGVFAVGLLGLYIGAKHVSSDTEGQPPPAGVQNLVSHQTNGFAHPLDSRYSTAAHHGSLVLGAITQGFEDPIGHGLGSTTLAEGKAGNVDTTATASEVDFSDMFVATGLVGGIAYLCVLYAAMRQGFRLLQLIPLRIALPVLACVSVTVTSWLRTGEYATNAIACFLLGSLSYYDNSRHATSL